MTYTYIPHACFKISEPPGLPETLEHAVRDEFDSVRRINAAPLLKLTLVLERAGKTFLLVAGESKYAEDEWIALVGPPDSPGMLDRLIGRKAPSSASELIPFCRKIHAALSTIPGVSDVRWYFEGSDHQSPAVATPDELPWPSGAD